MVDDYLLKTGICKISKVVEQMNLQGQKFTSMLESSGYRFHIKNLDL